MAGPMRLRRPPRPPDEATPPSPARKRGAAESRSDSSPSANASNPRRATRAMLRSDTLTSVGSSGRGNATGNGTAAGNAVGAGAGAGDSSASSQASQSGASNNSRRSSLQETTIRVGGDGLDRDRPAKLARLSPSNDSNSARTRSLRTRMPSYQNLNSPRVGNHQRSANESASDEQDEDDDDEEDDDDDDDDDVAEDGNFVAGPRRKPVQATARETRATVIPGSGLVTEMHASPGKVAKPSPRKSSPKVKPNEGDDHEASGNVKRLPGRRRAPHADINVEVDLRRQLELRVAFRAVVKALKPVLAELADRQINEFRENPELHTQRAEHTSIQAQLNEKLARRIGDLDLELALKEGWLNAWQQGHAKAIHDQFERTVSYARAECLAKLKHKLLSLARDAQTNDDSEATENEGSDVIFPTFGIQYRKRSRRIPLAKKYQSRTRFELEVEKATTNLETRADFRHHQNEFDPASLDPRPKGFAEFDGLQRARATAAFKLHLLADATHEVEERSLRQTQREQSQVSNTDAVKLQALATASEEVAREHVQTAKQETPVPEISTEAASDKPVATPRHTQRPPPSNPPPLVEEPTAQSRTALPIDGPPHQISNRGGLAPALLPASFHGQEAGHPPTPQSFPSLLQPPPPHSGMVAPPPAAATASYPPPGAAPPAAVTATNTTAPQSVARKGKSPIQIDNFVMVRPSPGEKQGRRRRAALHVKTKSSTGTDGKPFDASTMQSDTASRRPQQFSQQDASLDNRTQNFGRALDRAFVFKNTDPTQNPPANVNVPKTQNNGDENGASGNRRRASRPGPRPVYGDAAGESSRTASSQSVWSPFTNTMGPPTYLPKYVKGAELLRKNSNSNAPTSPLSATPASSAAASSAAPAPSTYPTASASAQGSNPEQASVGARPGAQIPSSTSSNDPPGKHRLSLPQLAPAHAPGSSVNPPKSILQEPRDSAPKSRPSDQDGGFEPITTATADTPDESQTSYPPPFLQPSQSSTPGPSAWPYPPHQYSTYNQPYYHPPPYGGPPPHHHASIAPSPYQPPHSPTSPYPGAGSPPFSAMQHRDSHFLNGAPPPRYGPPAHPLPPYPMGPSYAPPSWPQPSPGPLSHAPHAQPPSLPRHQSSSSDADSAQHKTPGPQKSSTVLSPSVLPQSTHATAGPTPPGGGAASHGPSPPMSSATPGSHSRTMSLQEMQSYPGQSSYKPLLPATMDPSRRASIAGPASSSVPPPTPSASSPPPLGHGGPHHGPPPTPTGSTGGPPPLPPPPPPPQLPQLMHPSSYQSQQQQPPKSQGPPPASPSHHHPHWSHHPHQQQQDYQGYPLPSYHHPHTGPPPPPQLAHGHAHQGGPPPHPHHPGFGPPPPPHLGHPHGLHPPPPASDQTKGGAARRRSSGNGTKRGGGNGGSSDRKGSASDRKQSGPQEFRFKSYERSA